MSPRFNRILDQSDQRDIILDLENVRVVDRLVIALSARWESRGVKLENCPSHVREWMSSEKDSTDG